MNCFSCADLYEFQAGHVGPFYCGQRVCQQQKRFDQIRTFVKNMRAADSMYLSGGVLYLRSVHVNVPIVMEAR